MIRLSGRCSRKLGLATVSFVHHPVRPAHRWPRKLSPSFFSQHYDAPLIAMAKQYKVIKDRGRKRQKLNDGPTPLREGSSDEILEFEVADLLARDQVSEEANVTLEHEDLKDTDTTTHASAEKLGEIELEIQELSSTGDGLALAPARDHVYVVPFAVPGDRVLAKIFKQHDGRSWSKVDFIKVLRPSPKREGVVPGCKYFSTCSGCQLQMLPYAQQLAHKRTIVEKAFRNFSGLSPSQVPEVGDTMGSPLQYGYRTKLTPHFDGPPRKKGGERKFTEVPQIGFTRKNMRQVMDIEQCPIGTPILNEGLKVERKKVADHFTKYKNGATILLRENTSRTSIPSDQKAPEPSDFDSIPEPLTKDLSMTASGAPQLTLTYPTHHDTKTYTSDNDSFTTEYISHYTFTSRAGSFFQNNNSILPSFISYVRAQAVPKFTPILDPRHPDPPIKYLLDAYCGSGLFAVTLSPLFSSVLGIDIDKFGIQAARLNAERNHIPNAGFIEADAGDLFADVPFPCDQSLVVIDPPRKGASEDFLRQLCQFGPKRVVYVSCNVHTQARDVGIMVKGFGGQWKYEIESLRGFDFFPQTGHVEGVCVLNRVRASAAAKTSR